METTDHTTEGDPLKSGDEGVETLTAPSATELKKKSCNEGLGFAKLTHWRTAVFFLSVFLCLIVVFAFSFIIPCPVRPQYLVTWNKTFSEAATYNFLAVEHASDDKVRDVLFVLENTMGTQNKSCADQGLSSPCVIMVAVDGTDGETLWERPLDPKFYWAQCGMDKDTERAWHCLLSHADNITAIDKYTGDVVWQQPKPNVLQSSLPVLSVPDLDGDKVRDVVLVASNNTQTQLVLLSGRTGVQIGSTVILDSMETSGHLLHRTKEGSYYILLQKDTGVYGLALWKIAAEAKAGMNAGLKTDKNLEKNASAETGLVPIYESEAASVLRTKETDDSSDLLLVTGTGVALVDGKKLQLRWRVNTSSVLSQPSFGYFNNDDVIDVVVEEDVGNNTKRILILDGKSGGELWDVNLLAAANSPRPASVHTSNYFSVFMFWGSMRSESNSSELLTNDRRAYMLHPLHSKVLLESPNVMDHIVTFRATLMERGRHAAYLLLMGPEEDGAEGTVVLSKHKLKQDVPFCKILRIGAGGVSETNDDILEAFNRLRFS
ncbi:protein FAM234A isoform 1-T2 [Odontesthes bonariensis]|uniref:protein FAM234A n=1 Tax=Odontesthes bonariensis TaxID=219752 RepID=UPI003F58532D